MCFSFNSHAKQNIQKSIVSQHNSPQEAQRNNLVIIVQKHIKKTLLV